MGVHSGQLTYENFHPKSLTGKKAVKRMKISEEHTIDRMFKAGMAKHGAARRS